MNNFNLSGAPIPLEILNKISLNFEDIKAGWKNPSGTKIYDSNPNNLVFELDEVPSIIFKVGTHKPELMRSRFRNIKRAQQICHIHNLNLLKIPKAILQDFKINQKTYSLLVEEKVEIVSDSSRQEQLYYEEAHKIDKAIQELAEFILKTGWSDVEWRNAPVVSDEVDPHGNRKIALIDLEEFGDIELGLFGGAYGRTGLVRLVNEKQAQAIIEIAKKNLPWTDHLENSAKNAYEQRQNELKENLKLQEFYLNKSIQKGDELINLDITTLCLPQNLYEPTKDLLDEINDLIRENKKNQSIKGRRNLILETHSFPNSLLNGKYKISEKQWRRHRLDHYKRRLPGDENDRFYFESRDMTIMAICLTKLVEAQAIFKKEFNKFGWVVQA